MSKFKRVLSAFMAFAMVLGMFSGLGGMFSTKASAADDGSNIDSYESLAAAYDNFVYLGLEFWEYGADKSVTLTDHYVDAGQVLQMRVFLKSDRYIGSGTIGFTFDNSFFDLKKGGSAYPASIAQTVPLYDGVTLGVNAENASVAAEGLTFTRTSNAGSGVSQIKQGYITLPEQDTVFNADTPAEMTLKTKGNNIDITIFNLVKTTTMGSMNNVWVATDDDWMLSDDVYVKSDLADGATGYVMAEPMLYKTYDQFEVLARGSRPWDIKSSDDASTLAKSAPSLATRSGSNVTVNVDHFLIEDTYHAFTIGKPSAVKSYKATFMANGEVFDEQTVKTGGDIVMPEGTPVLAGSTFKGWALDGEIVTFPQTMGKADVTYVAVFEEVQKYTATFYVDGDVYGPVNSYAAGEAITAPADPSKTGYTFTGWSPAVGKMGNADAEFEAVFAPKTYNAVFMANGAEFDRTVATFDAAYILPEGEPTLYGHYFVGWTNADGSAIADAHKVDGDVTFVAKFAPATYKATFKLDGGNINGNTADVDIDVVFGAEITAPADPVKDGYSFAGWSPAVDTMTEEGMTFTATWTANASGIILYDDDKTTVLDTIDGVYGQQITSIPDPAPKAGYEFAGWTYEDGTAITYPITLGTAQTKLYASWTAQTFYIEFYGYKDGMENTYLSGNNQECGAPLATPDAPKPGYNLIGWATTPDAIVPDAPATVPAAAATYYAVYEAIPYTATFTANGTVIDAATVIGGVGTTIAAPDAALIPAKTGYTFSHWVIAGTETKVNFPATMPIDGVAYEAVYNVNKWTITWKVDGNVVGTTEDVPYGSTIEAFDYQPPVGQSFGGWLDMPATMPDNDIVVNGSSSTDSYTVTWYVDGSVVDTTSHVYNAAIGAPDYVVPTGYKLSAWTLADGSAMPATMPAENIEVFATTSVLSFTVVYYADDAKEEKVAEYTINYGDTVTKPADPTKPGAIFDGWNAEIPGTMPAENLEFIATWTYIDYTVKFVNEDGSAIEGAEYTYKYGETVAADKAPAVSKEGNDFLGWKVNGEGDIIVFPYTVTGDVTLKPVFGKQSFSITYVIDGQTVKVDPYQFGDAVTEFVPEAKEGYKFSGWDIEIPATMPAGNLVASGTYDVQQYNAVFYDEDGVTVIDTVPTDFGKVPVAPAAPEKPGYTFVGWTPALSEMTTDGAVYTAKYSAGSTPYTVEIYTMDVNGAYGAPEVLNYAGATDTVATYEAAAKTGFQISADSVTSGKITADGKLTLKVYYIRLQYNVILVADGQTTEIPYYYGAAIGEIEAPVKAGHTFSGWDATIPATMPAKDITFNARFTINKYTIAFDSNGGSAVNSITANYGATITAPAAPTKEGYTFVAWSEEVPATMPDLGANGTTKTLVAEWAIESYTIEFNTDGGSAVDSITDVYGAEITAPADPTKEGHKFAGWSESIPATMPDLGENGAVKTIKANWTVNVYKVTFTIDGVDKVVDTKYAEVPVLPTAEETKKLGHTFDGWYVTGDETQTIVEIDAIGAADEAYTAKYTVNSYAAKFDLNGGVYAGDTADLEVMVEFGKPVTAPSGEVTREGYIFDGWSPAVENMDAEGKTYVAQWKQDLNFCRIQNVERLTSEVYGPQIAQYAIKVVGAPVKIEIVAQDGTGVSWTFDRNEKKVAEGSTGLISVASAADGTDAEIWTVSVILTEGQYKVRAKLDYSPDSWEGLDFAYDYAMAYDVKVDAEDKPIVMVASVDVSDTSVIRGEYVTFTIVASADVTRIRFRMPKGTGFTTVSYSDASTAVTIADNNDGTNTWSINMRLTYTEDVESMKQAWTVWYRTADVAWTETEFTKEIVVSKYEEPVTPDEPTVVPDVVSVAISDAPVAGEYATITVVTNSAMSRVRIDNGTKKYTYLPSSATVNAVTDDAAGTTTWTIQYKFADAGDYTLKIQARGTAWSEVDANSTLAVTVA